jgi:hypothetical protein
MQEAEKSNVVQIRDYAPRRVGISGTDRENVCAKQGQLLVWPRPRAPYPGGIDDLPI